MDKDNNLSNLNDSLFKQLERLNDDETLKDNFEKEIERTKAITSVAQTIINNANLALNVIKYTSENQTNLNTVPKMLQNK